MPLSNLNYLYEHLPARMVRDDDGLFLKRFLQPVGVELDGFDLQLDTFFEKIDPATAPAEFIDFWLDALFGWGYFPTWFTLDRRRAFYAAITQHYAERGTLSGIRNFLRAFGLRVIVEGAPRFWREEPWASNQWTVTGPLGIVVRLFPEAPAGSEQLEFWDLESTWGMAVPFSPAQSLQVKDVDSLLRFVWPLSQIIVIEDIQFGQGIPRGVPVGYGDGTYGETIPG